jgi:hypothetical protein
MKKISLMYQTFQGAWAIYGAIGYRQYMGYSKTEARKKYLAECNERIRVGTNTNGSKNYIIDMRR